MHDVEPYAQAVNVLTRREGRAGSGALIAALRAAHPRVVASASWDRSAASFFAVPATDLDLTLGPRALVYVAALHASPLLASVLGRAALVAAHSHRVAEWLAARFGREADAVVSPGPSPDVPPREGIADRFTILVHGAHLGGTPPGTEHPDGTPVTDGPLAGYDRVLEIARRMDPARVVFRLEAPHAKSTLRSGLTELGHVPEIIGADVRSERRFLDADCFLVASRSEGGPWHALDALAAGVQVVSTPVGEMPDVTPLIWETPDEAVAHVEELLGSRQSLFEQRGKIRAQLGGRSRATAGEQLVELLAKVDAPPKRVANPAHLRTARTARALTTAESNATPRAPRLVSVLMSAFRTARWVEQAMQSILDQALPAGWSLELLVGVDACEETLAAARRVRDPRVLVVALVENGGTYRALNALLAIARGELIAILDSDDVATPDRLRLQIERFEARPELMFVGGQYWSTDANLENPRRRPELPHDVNRAYERGASAYASHGAFTARRALYDRLGGYDDTRVGGDWELFLRAASLGMPAENLSVPVQSRRQHPSQLTQAPGTGFGSRLRRAYAARLARDEAAYRRGATARRIEEPARTAVRQVFRNVKSTLVVMPTIPARLGDARHVLTSLLAQRPSEVVVLLNGHDSDAGLVQDERVTYVLNPVGSGPATRLDVDPSGFDVVLYVDDDIRYPPDYLERCCTELDRLGPGAVVSFHGRYWLPGAHTYAERKVMHFRDAVDRAWQVPYAGTGVSALSGRVASMLGGPRPELFAFDDDLWMSSIVTANGLRLVRPATSAEWLAPLRVRSRSETLYGNAKANGFRQRESALAYAKTVFGFEMRDRREPSR